MGNEGNYAQFASVLSLAGMRPSGDFEVTESLGACVSRMNALEIANNVEIADWIIGGGLDPVNVRNMTLGELQDVCDAGRNIRHAAREETRIHKIAGTEDFHVLKNDAPEAFDRLKNVYPPEAGGQEIVSLAESFLAAMESIDILTE